MDKSKTSKASNEDKIVAGKPKGERIAKVMARAGLCSRRDAERWIESGRVQLNGDFLTTPATVVTELDEIIVDGFCFFAPAARVVSDFF